MPQHAVMAFYERMTIFALRPRVEAVDLTNSNLEIEEFDRLDQAANVLIERLQRLEDDKDSLDPAIFGKLRKEYDQKLKEAERRLKAKRKALTRKLDDLEDAVRKLSRRHDEIGREIKECEVRRRLGEYDDALYELYRTERESDQAFVMKKLDVQRRNISFYEQALAKEKDSFPCGACGSLNPIWEKQCRECGAELAEREGMRENPDEMVLELEKTLIRDLEAIEGDRVESPGEAAAPGQPCLVRIQGPSAGEKFLLEQDELWIGKAPENHVSIPPDRALSRRHAKICFEGGRAILYDLGSTNGTAVNGRAVEVSPLKNNDEITMGSSIYRMVL